MVFRVLFQSYNRWLHQYPIRSQSLSCAVLVGTGDVIAQKLIEKRDDLNVARTAKFFLFGLVYVGPMITFWFRFLDRGFGSKKILLKPWQKVIIDQGLYAPFINFWALPVLGLINQHSFDEIEQSIRKNYLNILLSSYKIWPAAQIVNFYFVPLHYRVLFASFISLIWNTYYTWVLGEK